MKIEFAVLHADKTWDTEVLDTPHTKGKVLLEEIEEWARIELLEGREFKGAAAVMLYNDNPDEGLDEEDED